MYRLVLAAAIIAHRGNSSQAPENTLTAFRQAIELGVDYIELDVHLSKEGVPIVIHDSILGRTTNHHSLQKISDLTVTEIQALDAGSWFDAIYAGEKVPTLEEVLHLPFGRTGLMIEIKDGTAEDARLAEKVADLLERKKQEFSVYVGSISPSILYHFRKRLPDQPIIAIIEDLESFDAHRENDPDIYAFKHRLLEHTMLRTLQISGKKVWVWTVDERDHIDRALDMQVDGVISNYPVRVQDLKKPEGSTPVMSQARG